MMNNRRKSKYDDVTVVKKYANRRLYNTATSVYITQEDLREMIQTDEDFMVVDAQSGEDITRGVLTQIILEQEAKGGNLLPTSFLKSLIGFYGDNMQAAVPCFLDVAMAAFQNNQDRWQEYVGSAMGGFSPLDQLEKMNQKNLELFENAMKMMLPFSAGAAESASSEEPSTPPAALNTLQQQINALQSQLDGLQGKTGS